MTVVESRAQIIDSASRELRTRVAATLEFDQGLAVVKAPPGSGKTHTLLELVEHAVVGRGLRVAVATQTNAQADDICKRLVKDHRGVTGVRFAAHAMTERKFGANVQWASKEAELPSGPCAVVGTTAKWGLIKLEEPFHALLVDEAWQMSWADFMLLGQVAPRFILIGDPGQISPVVTVRVERWETSPRAPHHAAPEVIERDGSISYVAGSLPASRRLPADSVELIAPFYDFPFGALAEPGDRYVVSDGLGGASVADGALDRLRDASAAVLTLPTPDGGPPLEEDPGIAALAAEVATRAVERGAVVADGKSEPRPLEACDVGIAATHRVMNNAVRLLLPGHLRDVVKVDTPERWQGLECALMVVVHPLSGVVRPSAFDLETGRLCVMASRHRAGLVVVARDHVPATLDQFVPSAENPVGRPDVTGRGHHRHVEFWRHIEERGDVVRTA